MYKYLMGRSATALMLGVLALALGACSSGNGGTAAVIPPPDNGDDDPPVSCAAPLAPEAMSQSLTINLPSDFDASASPRPTATTTIQFTVMLPLRCPGQSYPVVLQSHGYSGAREKAVGANGDLSATQAHFPSINTLVRALPYHGYVVISYDERGHGVARPGQAAHNARAIDPAAETQDAIAILDWAHDNAEAFFIQREPDTGISKDIRVGTIGYSYGGGFELPLALLDARVDTIVPNGTWNNLLYSLLPGDAVKLGFDSLLCLLAIQGNVNNTPLLATLCSLIGPTGPAATALRTRTDLATAATRYVGTTRAARDTDELLNLFYTHGTRYFELPTRDGAAVNPFDNPGYISPALTALTGLVASPGLTLPKSAERRPIPALFVQGNRDTLFNLTDAYFNYVYFKEAGGDVRLLTTEGGHMNPLARQTEGTANCGGVVGVEAMLAWFDEKLKGRTSATYEALPQVCISVTPTPGPSTAPVNANLTGVLLDDVPVGSLSGTGAIAAAGDVALTTVTAPASPVFVQIGEPIAVDGAVLAGIPRVQSVLVDTVTGVAPAPGAPVPVAYVGVGIRRGSSTILVDDEVTPFAMLAPVAGSSPQPCPEALALPATAHCNNRGTGNSEVLLPGVGELLLKGDRVGLLFYENHVQYLPANNAGSAAQTGLSNPYRVRMTGVGLPLLVPGSYPGSSLSTPTPAP